MKRLSLLVAAVISAAGCGTPGGGGDGGSGTPPEYDCTDAVKVTTATLQTEIFDPRCKSCHLSDNDPSTPGNMSTAAKTQELVGKASTYVTTGSSLKNVDPNNPQNSSLYLKVLGGGTKYKGPKGEAVGVQMPQGQTPLTDAEKTKIKNWICTGATAQ